MQTTSVLFLVLFATFVFSLDIALHCESCYSIRPNEYNPSNLQLMVSITPNSNSVDSCSLGQLKFCSTTSFNGNIVCSNEDYNITGMYYPPTLEFSFNGKNISCTGGL